MKKLHISDNEIQKQAGMIFTPILHGESATALCYPCCKIAYNLSSFLQRPSLLRHYLGPYFKRHEFITIILEKNETFESFIAKIPFKSHSSPLLGYCKNIVKKGKEPYFFILQADEPSSVVLDEILTAIHSCILQLGQVGAMVFFETNALNSKSTEEMLQKNNKLLQNILYFPTYTKKERVTFLRNLATDWGCAPPQGLLDNLSLALGGSLWLLREGLRCFRDYGLIDINEIATSPGIKLRIHTILEKLSIDEKKCLMQIHAGHHAKTPEDVKGYFFRIGLIEKHQNKWQIAIPVLIPYLEQAYTADFFAVADGRILFRDRDISLLLTPQEKIVLTVLLNRRGTLVSKELIAKALWKDAWEELYSDWAIDKVISRLRIVLAKIGLSKNIIQVKKKRGIQI